MVEAGSRKHPRAGSSPDSSGPASCLHTHPVCSVSGHLLLQLLRDGSSIVPLSSVPEPAPSHLGVLAFKRRDGVKKRCDRGKTSSMSQGRGHGDKEW